MNSVTAFVECIPSAIGTVLAVSDESGRVLAVDWEDHETRLRGWLDRHYGSLDLSRRRGGTAVGAALRGYFDGRFDALDALHVSTRGTQFQEMVWAALRRIPAGTTISYARLAGRIGQPRAVRAVARANATNPVSILIPCHRVIGGDGELTGYAGGVARKRWLLEHEARWTPSVQDTGRAWSPRLPGV